MVEANNTAAEARFVAIGMQGDTVKNLLKNAKKTQALIDVLDCAGVQECNKQKGSLFQALATKLKPNQANYKEIFAKQIAEEKWTRADQVDEGMKWLDAKLAKDGKTYVVDVAELDSETGVGVVVTEEQIDETVNALFAENAS